MRRQLTLDARFRLWYRCGWSVISVEKLRAACEKWLGTHWEITILPAGYAVSFLYEPTNALAYRMFLRAANETDLLVVVLERVPELHKLGKMK